MVDSSKPKRPRKPRSLRDRGFNATLHEVSWYWVFTCGHGYLQSYRVPFVDCCNKTCVDSRAKFPDSIDSYYKDAKHSSWFRLKHKSWLRKYIDICEECARKAALVW